MLRRFESGDSTHIICDATNALFPKDRLVEMAPEALTAAATGTASTVPNP